MPQKAHSLLKLTKIIKKKSYSYSTKKKKHTRKKKACKHAAFTKKTKKKKLSGDVLYIEQDLCF